MIHEEEERERPGRTGAQGFEDEWDDNTRNGGGRKDPTLSGNHHDRDDRIRGDVKRRAKWLSQRHFGDGNDWEAFVAEAEGDVSWDRYEAWQERKGWKFAQGWEYRTPDDMCLLYEAMRYNYKLMPSKKKFVLRHKEGEKWVFGAGPVRVPYNLPELLKRSTERIVQVEGEKGVEKLRPKGILGSCVQGQNWTDDVAQFYAGREVILSMDNDDAGRENTETAREELAKVGARVRIVSLPGLGPRKGLDDWLEDHSVEEFWAIVERTPIVGRAAPHAFPPEEEIPRYEWLMGKHILRGEVAGSAAQGGTGKSNLSIVEALSMASGKALLHDTVPQEPLRVVLINLEDNRNTMDKRIAAAMRHFELTPTDIGNRLMVVAKCEIQIKIAKQSRGGDVGRNEDDIRLLTEMLVENQADVLSIDSFIRTHGVNENDNKAIQAVIACFEDVASAANCGIHLWHHTRKMGGDKASVEAARGAQAFIDACRSVRILETMTRQDRNDLLAVMPDIGEPGYYFRAFNGKRNFAPPSDQSDWFKYKSIKLRNWRSEFEDDGDKVGVVTPWKYPKFEPPTITPTDVDRILAVIKAGGPWRANQLSTKEPWVGVPIARALGLDLLDKRAKKAVVKVVKDLIAADRLRVVKRQDEHREDRDYVEVAVVE